MQKWLAVRLVASVLLVSTLAYAQQEPLIPAETLRAQLDFIVQTIEEVHPDPYARVTEEVFKGEVTRVRASLDRAMTSAQFYELVAPLVSSLEDDHTLLLSKEPPGTPSETPFVCREDSVPEFYVIRDVGVLSMPSFSAGGKGMTYEEVQEDLEAYAQFIEQAFQTFKDEEVKFIAVDLRENVGGNSQVGEMILQYVTEEPHRMVSRMDVKVSKRSRAWKRQTGGGLPDDFRKPLGTVLQYDLPPVNPEPTPLRFGGEVYVLTSQCTASSATDFAAVVKDFELGTIVGEETGGLPTDFGDYIPFSLPEVGLELRVSHKYFVRPGGFDDGRGVLPDVEVPASQALQWVLSHAQ